MQKYPIGLQDFRGIREGGYLYVDKTPLIYELIESGKYYFLSRPRRFGKSLLLSTIKEIFNGRKELFKGLWIEDNWDWGKTNPVIHLSLSRIEYENGNLYKALDREMDRQAKDKGFQLETEGLKSKFEELIIKTSAAGKVVLLIDEYDKPLVDYLNDLPTLEENRAVFKLFYSILKDADEYIRLLLLTGVSRFSKVSIFPDLNNLKDITIQRKYATITGITQQELEDNFAGEIVEMKQSAPDILEQLKWWYNGYSWYPDADRVYNPFSLLNFMDDRDFQNYWFLTGTPTWLVKHMHQNKEFDLEHIRIGGNALGNFNTVDIESAPVLFQTGYLTIKGYDPETGQYELGYPNKEVKDSLVDNLLSAYREVYPGKDSVAVTADLGRALKANDAPKMIGALDALIATIPYDHWKAESESVFHIIVHLAFRRLGADVRSEVHSATGRCDVLVLTDRYIYALELKLDSSPEKALEQIADKGYLRPYQLDKRPKIAIGINFSSDDRKVKDYLVKEF